MNHSHVLYDNDPHFKIDSITRNITNESSKKTRLIQHDHNSERFTFEANRYVEGHDLLLCNNVEIHYLNIESNTKIARAGVYTVDDLQMKSDDKNTLVCSWLVSNHATQCVGQLQFLVRFSCINEDTGNVEYVWNTAPYSSITVSSGIYNDESASDNLVHPFNFVTTITGQTLKFFVGTRAEYESLTAMQKLGLFAILTDDKTREELEQMIIDTIAERLPEAEGDLREQLDVYIREVEGMRSDLEHGAIVVAKAENLVDNMYSVEITSDDRMSGVVTTLPWNRIMVATIEGIGSVSVLNTGGSKLYSSSIDDSRDNSDYAYRIMIENFDNPYLNTVRLWLQKYSEVDGGWANITGVIQYRII